MYKKRYGDSRVDNCPFCGKVSVTKNKQGVPVCKEHKEDMLTDLKCVCGEWLDAQEGKWGPYFRCMNCGNISFWKGIELNPQVRGSGPRGSSGSKSSSYKKKAGSNDSRNNPGEITVTSDQIDYIY